MGISADDLLGMETAVLAFMPTPGTISRTGATIACRIERDSSALIHQKGLPIALNVRRWLIHVPNTVDIRVGDTLTVPGSGTYTILAPDAPSAYSPDVVCMAVLTRTASGGWPIVTNNTVQFRHPNNAALSLLSASVFIEPISFDARLTDVGAEFDYTVTFDPSLTYSDGTTKVGVNHEILWSRLRNPRHVSKLHFIRYVDTPVPLAMAMLKDGD